MRGGRTPIFYSGKNIHKERIKGLYSNVMRWSSNIVKKKIIYIYVRTDPNIENVNMTVI